MSITTTAPHRPLTPWVLALVGIVLIGLLAVSGVRITWDAPTVGPAAPSVDGIAEAHLARAERMAVARHELRVQQASVREVPALRSVMHDDMQLLELVGSGQVPVEALDEAP